MKQHITAFRVCAEIIIAVVIGFVIASKSAWCDPDAVVDFYWFPVLLAVGLMFGLFGRCPVLVIGPATSFVSIFAAIGDVFYYGFSAGMFNFYVIYFTVMTVVVSIGAAIGRGAKRYWIKRRLKYAT